MKLGSVKREIDYNLLLRKGVDRSRPSGDTRSTKKKLTLHGEGDIGREWLRQEFAVHPAFIHRPVLLPRRRHLLRHVEHTAPLLVVVEVSCRRGQGRLPSWVVMHHSCRSSMSLPLYNGTWISAVNHAGEETPFPLQQDLSRFVSEDFREARRVWGRGGGEDAP